MNGMATVSPLFVPNLCVCGHDWIAHTFGAPQQCSLCFRGAGLLNRHNFTSDNELWPSAPFPASDPARTVTAGGFGFGVSATTAAAGNGLGVQVVTFVALPAGIAPGWSFTTIPSGGGGNNVNQAQYFVRSVNFGANQITIDPPGLLANSPSIPCLFAGSIGSTMGPGRPPNGQRAG